MVEEIDPVAQDDDWRVPFLGISTLDERALSLLRSLTLQVNHRYHSPDGGYEAFFSCLLPRDLSLVNSISGRKWELGADTIDFDEFIIETPTRFFLKGVASASENATRGHGRLNSIALNVLKPSLVRPDLSRSHVDTTSVNLDGFWRDVANHVRELIAPHMQSIEGRVRGLSAADGIAKIPTGALLDVVPENDWPVWALEPGRGLAWRESSAFLDGDEVLEAPDELSYVLGGQYFSLASQHAQLWEGPNCFVTIPHSDFWWAGTTLLSQRLLEKRGFVPTRLLPVSGSDGDDVPLVCRVWRKQPAPALLARDMGTHEILSEWRRDPLLSYPELYLQRALTPRGHGLTEFPHIIPFPNGWDEIAGIGSLYWNQSNRKIHALVEVLLQLSERYVGGAMSESSRKKYDYFNDTAYLGYVVRSRHSSSRSAISRFANLLDLAKQEGLAVPDALRNEDFLPGSTGEYWNPYHYAIWSWPKSRRTIGVPLAAGRP